MVNLNLENLTQSKKYNESFSNIVVATNHHDYQQTHTQGNETSSKVEVKKDEKEIKEGWNVVNTVGFAGSMYSATMVQLAKQVI